MIHLYQGKGKLENLVKFAKENGNPLQYSCLENSMDRGARWATVHGVAKVLGMTEQLNSNKVKLVYYRRL